MELWKLSVARDWGLGLRLLEATLHFKANNQDQDLQPANLGAASFWNQISLR